jgi:hypothetical protein
MTSSLLVSSLGCKYTHVVAERWFFGQRLHARYGTIVGSDEDAKEFKRLVKSCEVQILTKE